MNYKKICEKVLKCYFEKNTKGRVDVDDYAKKVFFSPDGNVMYIIPFDIFPYKAFSLRDAGLTGMGGQFLVDCSVRNAKNKAVVGGEITREENDGSVTHLVKFKSIDGKHTSLVDTRLLRDFDYLNMDAYISDSIFGNVVFKKDGEVQVLVSTSPKKFDDSEYKNIDIVL